MEARWWISVARFSIMEDGGDFFGIAMLLGDGGR